MSKKSTTKAPKKSAVTLTPKQAVVASASLLRGLDNAVKDNQRTLAKLVAIQSKVGTLSSGLSNLAAAPAAKPAAKAAAKPAAKAAAKPAAKTASVKAVKAVPVKAAKPVAKAAAKPAAPRAAKAAPAAKAPAAAKPTPAPAAAAPKAAAKTEKPPVPGRPSVRVATKEILAANGGRMPSAALREAVKDKYGYYSNQTFYDTFKKDPELSLVDNFVSLKADKVDELVRRVEQDRSTASVV